MGEENKKLFTSLFDRVEIQEILFHFFTLKTRTYKFRLQK